ncbi:MAG TPA: cytochrome b/b6 domain-containing protein [Thiobacillaceae bacterium]|nr:cytochrome b/b6 domain-containing protein [Thiobacillaceae bacterium]HNU63422.1 cytochrome b/b6 domain-containing protein [Thiobacillaceae bacterium]
MERLNLIRERVYDPVLRIIHLWIALLVLLLLLSGLIAKWIAFTPEAVMLWRYHTWLGYGLVLGLTARTTWALYGPMHAGWRQLWAGRAWLDALKNRTFFAAPTRFGLHPSETVIYLAFYLMAWLLALTGLALAAIAQGQGPLYAWLGHDVLLRPWFGVPHAVLEDGMLIFVVVHLMALIWHERRHGMPLAQAMVSGYQYRKDADV